MIPPATIADLQEDMMTTGVMWRRVVAWLIDGALIGMIAAALWSLCVVIGVVTFGLGIGVFGALPLVPLLYHWLTMASPMSASPGQAIMGLVVRHNDDLGPISPLQALAFTVLLYLTIALGALWVLVVLVTRHHRTFHDMLSGVVVVRARALSRATAFWNMCDAARYQR